MEDFHLTTEQTVSLKALHHTWHGRSIPGETTALKSKLLGILQERTPTIEAHLGLGLTESEKYRFAVWMDTYAHIVGSFSEEQDEGLVQFRVKVQNLLEP